MQFVSTRIITDNLPLLVEFYEKVTATKLARLSEDFAELITPIGTLALGSTRTVQLFGGPAVARAAANQSAIIEFLVTDVDAQFERLESMLGDALVQKPTTMPWGNRSLLFRDPDGNLVNLFTPVTPAARAKFAR